MDDDDNIFISDGKVYPSKEEYDKYCELHKQKFINAMSDVSKTILENEEKLKQVRNTRKRNT